MKLTTKQLKRIIKEELNKIMNEGSEAFNRGMVDGPGNDYNGDEYSGQDKLDYDQGFEQAANQPPGNDADEEPQPSKTSQAWAKAPKKGMGKYGELQMAWKAVLAYNNEQLEYNPDWHPVSGFVDKVAKDIAWYFENENRPPDETELNDILDQHDAE